MPVFPSFAVFHACILQVFPMTLPIFPHADPFNGVQLLWHKDKCLSGFGVNPEQRRRRRYAERFGL
jgi:hypothetical protein